MLRLPLVANALVFLLVPFVCLGNATVSQRGTRPEIIYIDAGHGGKDQGTAGKNPFYEEKQLTLSLAVATQNYLRRMGYRPVMTRTSDVFVDLYRRASLANSGRADVFVSIHCNHSSNAAAFGTEVYFYNGKGAPVARVRQSEELGKQIMHAMERCGSLKSRAVKVGNFAVIRETTMPAVLVETGFLSNPKERGCLLDGRYRMRLAKGIAEGIHAYLSARGSKKASAVKSVVKATSTPVQGGKAVKPIKR